MGGKAKDPDLSFLREEQIMKDSRRKRDVIKLEENANSVKETNDIEG